MKEKSDKEVFVYQIHFKDEQPKLCFLRHLLVFVHCCKHASNKLYRTKVSHHDDSDDEAPSEDEEEDDGEGGEDDDLRALEKGGLLYKVFLKWITKELKNHINFQWQILF